MLTEEQIAEIATKTALQLREERSNRIPSEEHEAHHEYIRTKLKREYQSIRLRQAIIDKTIAGIVWSVLVALVAYLLNLFKEHWK